MYAHMIPLIIVDEAPPNDPDVISFTKGDLLEILDKSTEWWRARTANGTLGGKLLILSSPLLRLIIE